MCLGSLCLATPKKHPLASKSPLFNHLHYLLQSCPQTSVLLFQEGNIHLHPPVHFSFFSFPPLKRRPQNTTFAVQTHPLLSKPAIGLIPQLSHDPQNALQTRQNSHRTSGVCWSHGDSCPAPWHKHAVDTCDFLPALAIVPGLPAGIRWGTSLEPFSQCGALGDQKCNRLQIMSWTCQNNNVFPVFLSAVLFNNEHPPGLCIS